MFQNYMKTAIRNILRNKLFSVINIVGLAIGLAAFLLIVLFVKEQFSWESHWQGSDDMYRIENTYLREGLPARRTPNAVDPIKDIFLQTFPEIEDVTRYFSRGLTVVRGGQLARQQVTLVDQNFFNFFKMNFIEGSAETALSGMQNAVISERIAQRYFGDVSAALGKTITVRGGGLMIDYQVSAVIADPAEKTQIPTDMVVPFNREYFVGARWFTEDWRYAIRRTFVKLKEGADPALMATQFPSIVERYLPKTQVGQETGRNWSVDISMVPIQDIRLYGNDANTNPDVLFGLLGIAFLILIIAVVNYLNLSMARTVHRAREVAVRKVVGASNGQITTQFLGESIFLAFWALLLAQGIAELALPTFNEFLTSVIAIDMMSEPVTFVVLVVLGIGVGLSAGSFQAVFFAALKPKNVLYSNTAADNGTSRLRSALVVLQFTISIGLMIVTFFMNRQTEYAQSLDLGFNADDLVVVAGTNNNASETFKLRLLESPFIQAVGRSSDVPTEGSEDRLLMQPVNGDEKVTLDGLPSGPDFFKAYQIKLLAGRFLDNSDADTLRYRTGENTAYKDAANILVNLSGIKKLGFASPAEAIGQIIPTDLSNTLRINATIVGVVDDFHFDSARDVIRPGIYYHDEQRRSDMSVRIDGANRDLAIAAIREAWNEIYPENIFQYRVMADMVEQQYQSEDRAGEMLQAFTLLAMLISCMGLYGLASFTAERRTKEIGLRKVLGASLRDIVALLLWQFSKPILVANLIAWPAAFYFLNDWLGGFAYRIELSIVPFLAVSLMALIIGWLTVLTRAWVVAHANPIHALRYE